MLGLQHNTQSYYTATAIGTAACNPRLAHTQKGGSLGVGWGGVGAGRRYWGLSCERLFHTWWGT